MKYIPLTRFMLTHEKYCRPTTMWAQLVNLLPLKYLDQIRWWLAFTFITFFWAVKSRIMKGPEMMFYTTDRWPWLLLCLIFLSLSLNNLRVRLQAQQFFITFLTIIELYFLFYIIWLTIHTTLTLTINNLSSW